MYVYMFIEKVFCSLVRYYILVIHKHIHISYQIHINIWLWTLLSLTHLKFQSRFLLTLNSLHYNSWWLYYFVSFILFYFYWLPYTYTNTFIYICMYMNMKIVCVCNIFILKVPEKRYILIYILFIFDCSFSLILIQFLYF